MHAEGRLQNRSAAKQTGKQSLRRIGGRGEMGEGRWRNEPKSCSFAEAPHTQRGCVGAVPVPARP